uniref:Uncharacterized protein n=1 Tax=Oryza brachyantha TaxID=4533 RepID=J3L5S5_ORYBR
MDSGRPVPSRDRSGRRLRPRRPRVEQLGQTGLDAVGGGRRQWRGAAWDECAEDGADAVEHGAGGARHEADGLLVALVPQGLLLEALHLEPLRFEVLLERVGAGRFAGGRRGHRLRRDRPAQATPPTERELPLGGLQLVERLHFGAQPGRGRDEPPHLPGLHLEPLGDERVQPSIRLAGLEARVHPAEVEPAPQPKPRDGGRRRVQRHDQLGAGQPEEERLVRGVEVRHAGRPHRVGPQPRHLLLQQRPVQRQQPRHRRRRLEREDLQRRLRPRRQPQIDGQPHLLHNHEYFSSRRLAAQGMDRCPRSS